MIGTLVFDMDGTIADLYGVENWLEMLRAEDPTPYAAAAPIYDMIELIEIVHRLKENGWRIAITTWGAMNASEKYNAAVAKVKKSWLEKYNFPFDFFFFQEYGTPKNSATQAIGGRQVLVDDNEQVRDNWTGETIDATQNILKELEKLYN